MEGLDRTTMQMRLPKMAKEQREVDPIPSIQKAYPTPLQAAGDLSPLPLESELLFGKRDPGAVKLSMNSLFCYSNLLVTCIILIFSNVYFK
jgi:hypothetical protein